MKKYIKVYMYLIKLNIEKDLIYSLNSWFLLFTTAVYSITFVLSLEFIFNEFSNIMGFTQRELTMLVLMSQLWWYVHVVFVRKNLQLLADLINNGRLDFFLLKPLPFRKILPVLEFDQRHVLPAIILGIYISYEFFEIGGSVFEYVLFCLSIMIGVVISFFFVSIFICLNFWIGRNEGIFEVMISLPNLAQLPYKFYSGANRLLFLFVIPAIVLVNPAFGIMFGFEYTDLFLLSILIMLVLGLISHLMWVRGLRNYTSAN